MLWCRERVLNQARMSVTITWGKFSKIYISGLHSVLTKPLGWSVLKKAPWMILKHSTG